MIDWSFMTNFTKLFLATLMITKSSHIKYLNSDYSDEGNTEVPAFVTTTSGGIINADYVDTEYVDPTIADFSNELLQPTISIGNPMYKDPFLEGENMAYFDFDNF